jgi:hypothetical protein
MRIFKLALFFAAVSIESRSTSLVPFAAERGAIDRAFEAVESPSDRTSALKLLAQSSQLS